MIHNLCARTIYARSNYVAIQCDCNQTVRREVKEVANEASDYALQRSNMQAANFWVVRARHSRICWNTSFAFAFVIICN
jgi:hypothetical protein